MPATRWRGRRAGRGPEPERAVDVHPRAAAAPLADRPRSSNAPVLTLPACAHTIVGAAAPRRAPRPRSAWIAPLPSAATSTDRRRRNRAAQRTVDRRVPLHAGERPGRRRADQTVALDVLAAAREHLVARRGQPTVFAAWPPVTKPTDAGRACRAAPSTTRRRPLRRPRPPGDDSALNAGLIPPGREQIGGSAASSEPPITKPKYRGPVVATSPGSAAAAARRVPPRPG